MSVVAGANLIGILTTLIFIFAMAEMIRFSHIYAWFLVPTLCYGMASGLYIRCLFRDTRETRRDFFVFYVLLVVISVRIYEYILYSNHPVVFEEICEFSDD